MSASAAYENTHSNTGNQRTDIVEIAKTQIGNTSSSKYGGAKSWCAQFVVWCARQAGIGEDTIKTTGWACADDLGVPYYDRASHTPKSGDLVFFNWPSTTTTWDHVGIVESVDSNGTVHTIEGNNTGSNGVAAVRRATYSTNGYSEYSRLSSIRGYGVPNYKGGYVTHTVDSSYGNNFTAYPKARITAENIFDANHNQISSTAWIGTSDMCTIHEVYTDGCCKVSYPLDSGETKTVYSKFSLFDINVHTHSYTSTVVAPTCTEQGYTVHTCACNDSYTDSYVPALGHSDGAWVTTVEPTCLGEGTEKIYCTRCNAELNSRQIAPLGHDYASEVVTEATCKGKGQMKYVCKRCEFTYYDVIPAKGHNHEEAIWVTTVAPTCTASGEQSAYCPDCNELIETRAVEALGHDDGKWVITSQPGCESKGEETCYCTRCGKIIDSRPIDALGHDDGTWVVVTKPTCREDGQEVLFCTRCGKAIDKRTVNALGHDEGVWKIDFEPTANHDGQMSRYCTRCDEVLETKSFKMHTHREGYRETVTEATCTTDGIGGIFCADCGAKYDTYVISALGHDYNDWYMNNNGTHSRTCSRCHNFESENCDFEVTVKEATCTEAGYTTHVCKICGYTYVDGNVDALGHAWGEWVDDGNGETHTRTCSGCGITETEEHHWGEWKLNKDATLFKNGTKTRVCPDCGATETIGSIHTAWLVRIPYTIVLWIGNILKKVLYILSFQWFLPNHGIPPIH